MFVETHSKEKWSYFHMLPIQQKERDRSPGYVKCKHYI